MGLFFSVTEPVGFRSVNEVVHLLSHRLPLKAIRGVPFIALMGIAQPLRFEICECDRRGSENFSSVFRYS